jgi:glutathione S-transferase
MTQYHLYAHRNSYAMTTHLLLEELEVEYTVSWFNVHKPEEFPPEFLSLNPNARVPVLVVDDEPVYESAATMMLLCEQHEHRFLPPPGHPKRGRVLQCLYYLMSTFQPEVLIQFHPDRYFPDDKDMQQRIMQASLRELEHFWRVLDDDLNPGPFFMGESYGICDMLFLMQAVWTENQPVSFAQFPHAKEMMLKAFERPAVQRIMEINDIQHLTNLKD